MSKANRDILLLIAFFTLVRLAVSPSFGLGVDEAHYFLYAKYLDISYVDHPPLVGWFHALIYSLFGTSEFLVRLPAIILFALTTYLVYQFTAALAVTNWTLGSRITYYALPYGIEVFVIDKRVDQFDFLQKHSPLGYDPLFVNTHFDREDIENTYHCDAVQPAKDMDILLNGGKVNSVDFVWCRNFRGDKP
jgi:hypothetical protein